jgi:hypothetical protein
MGMAIAAGSTLAYAQDAETLFREGRKALDAGDWTTACAKFSESQRLEPAPGTLVNVARCEERAGKLLMAVEHFRTAASGFTRAEARKAATDKANEIEGKIGKLTLSRKGLPDGARVRDGDAPVTQFETPQRVDPGTHTVTVEFEGHEAWTREVVVPEGGSVEVALEVGKKKAVNAPPSREPRLVEPPKTGPSPLRPIGIVTVGVGGAALIAGSVIGILALGSSSTYKERCDAQNRCDQEGFDAASALKWQTPASTVLILGGAALVVGGAVLYFVAPKGSKPQPAQGFRAPLAFEF